MKRLYIFITVILFAAITVSAQQISREVAVQKASAFINKSNPLVKQMLTLAYQADKAATLFSTKGDAYFYVFNRGFNQGFVIVSGDERTPNDILGYSNEGSFDPNNIPPSLKYFLEEYEQQIKYMQENNIQPAKAIARAPKNNIDYLIKTKWDQGSPYNYYLSGCYTGCVATAMAQVMFYWQWPQEATTTIPAYSVYGNSLSGSSLAPTTFEWSKMKLTYNSFDYNDDHAVARLMQYAGHAVKMQYSTTGSGAYERDIINAMTNYFGYPKDEQLIYRTGLTSTQWADTIYANLADEIPVIMCGANSGGGHCFICDGYKDGKYHINWGWSGYSDTYFDLEVLAPSGTGSGASGSGGYTSNRSIVTRIHNPNKVIPALPEDSIPLSAESVRLYSGAQALTREVRANSVSSDLRYYFSVGSNITDENQVDTLITGLGCYDEFDNLIGVYGTRYRLFDSYGGSYSDDIESFGSEVPYGTYKFYPVWGDVVANRWRKINGVDHRYIQAVVAEDGKTVNIAPSSALSVQINESTSGSGSRLTYNQTMVATNVGTEPYTGGLYILCEGYILGEVAIEELAVGASKTISVTNYIGTINYDSSGQATSVTNGKTSMNNLEVMVLNSLTLTDGLWDNYKDLVGLYNFWTDAPWTGSSHVGNNLKFSVELANFGYKSSSQSVKVTLFPKGGKVTSGTSVTKSINLKPYSLGSAEFEFNNITYGKEYDIEVRYNAFGEQVGDTLSLYGYGVKPVKGALVYGESSYLLIDDSVSTWKPIPDDALYVDARMSDHAASIVPGNNPNTVYLLAEGSQVPTSLEGKNVVIGTNCAELKLEDGYGFFTPIDFTAQKASYRRTFVNGNDGTTGNWETLLLPFDVTSVTKDNGTPLSWFTNLSQHGKNFWIYRFADEDENNTAIFNCPESATTLAGLTPYLITVPAQSPKWSNKWVLTGKELTFSGENVTVKSSGKSVTTLGAAKKFDFIGHTYTAETNQIYYLTEAGDRFENSHNAWALLNPFRCYFVGYFNNEALTVKMRFGDNESTGIEETMADSDEPTAVAPTVYTLDGKAVGTDVKQLPVGTYVTKGKKFMVNKFTPSFPRLK